MKSHRSIEKEGTLFQSGGALDVHVISGNRPCSVHLTDGWAICVWLLDWNSKNNLLSASEFWRQKVVRACVPSWGVYRFLTADTQAIKTQANKEVSQLKARWNFNWLWLWIFYRNVTSSEERTDMFSWAKVAVMWLLDSLKLHGQIYSRPDWAPAEVLCRLWLKCYGSMCSCKCLITWYHI